MKLTKIAGKKKLTISKKEWMNIGRKSGWVEAQKIIPRAVWEKAGKYCYIISANKVSSSYPNVFIVAKTEIGIDNRKFVLVNKAFKTPEDAVSYCKNQGYIRLSPSKVNVMADYGYALHQVYEVENLLQSLELYEPPESPKSPVQVMVDKALARIEKEREQRKKIEQEGEEWKQTPKQTPKQPLNELQKNENINFIPEGTEGINYILDKFNKGEITKEEAEFMMRKFQ